MNISVVSLFSGGGGLDLGFLKAGYDIIWATDINKDAVATYKANIGGEVICADLNDIDEDSIPNSDIIIGGPPCQSFSLAGKRDPSDKRGQLIWKYLNILKRKRPKAFVFENVVGLLSAKNETGQLVFPILCEAFEQIGYTVSAKVVNAADYGVPQFRKRVIVIGIQANRKFNFPAPTHNCDGTLNLKKYVSVKEALDDLPKATNSPFVAKLRTIDNINNFLEFVRDSPVVTEHTTPRMSDLDQYIINHVKPGGNYMDIPSDVPSVRIRRLQKEGGHTTCYGRLHPDKPAHTINTYFNRPNVGCNIHYKEKRLITVREALRLQSFPDSYKLIAKTKHAKHLIVGNAVPPIMANIIALQLKHFL